MISYIKNLFKKDTSIQKEKIDHYYNIKGDRYVSISKEGSLCISDKKLGKILYKDLNKKYNVLPYGEYHIGLDASNNKFTIIDYNEGVSYLKDTYDEIHFITGNLYFGRIGRESYIIFVNEYNAERMLIDYDREFHVGSFSLIHNSLLSIAFSDTSKERDYYNLSTKKYISRGHSITSVNILKYIISLEVDDINLHKYVDITKDIVISNITSYYLHKANNKYIFLQVEGNMTVDNKYILFDIRSGEVVFDSVEFISKKGISIFKHGSKIYTINNILYCVGEFEYISEYEINEYFMPDRLFIIKKGDKYYLYNAVLGIFTIYNNSFRVKKYTPYDNFVTVNYGNITYFGNKYCNIKIDTI